MILLIDNYDSFSYNLYQLIGSIEPDIKVVRNDALTPEDILEMKPDGIVISPGPGKPEDAGICIDVVKKLGGKIPILGVCLGHQSISVAYGATVSYASKLMHGKQSNVKVDTTCKIFEGLNETLPVARYHSLATIPDTIPDCLKVTAITDTGDIMAIEHIEYPVYGLQFHPESIMTPDGEKMLRNFIDLLK